MTAAQMRARFVLVNAMAACVAASGCAKHEAANTAGDSASNKPAGATIPVAPVSEWTVTEYGMGKLRAGMSYTDANDTLKGALVAAKNANFAECDFAHWTGAPPGILVMVNENRIARIDVDSVGVSTREGATIGNTEAQILALYPGRVVVSPHAYTEGHYLTVRAVNPADSLYRLVFETDKGKVTTFRVGIMPAVEYVEGCS